MDTNSDDRSNASNSFMSKADSQKKVATQTMDEYCASLRVWMNQLYQHQCMAANFPYFIAALQTQAAVQSNLGGPVFPSSSAHTSTVTHTVPQQPVSPTTQTPQPQNTAQQPQQNPRGVEYVIPPLWKRVVAELMDFFLLFAIKLAVTFAAVDAFDLLSDVEKYDFENFGTDIVADYKMALEMTSEILVLELIHRVGTCVFEALCLHRGAGGAGGSTPGKKMMGLRVVRCQWVAPTIGDKALVFPATDLGLGRAILRSVVKNFSLTFLFPICFTLFSFQYNRTVYDIIGGSIVIEEQHDLRNRRNPH